jgi:hypothetical protein
MQAGVYQNGGDWDWFGARMVQVLVDLDPAAAYREIKPMVARVLQAGGFYEWWDLAGNPHGSPRFRGAAGALGWAIVLLLRWAEQH